MAQDLSLNQLRELAQRIALDLPDEELAILDNCRRSVTVICVDAKNVHKEYVWGRELLSFFVH